MTKNKITNIKVVIEKILEHRIASIFFLLSILIFLMLSYIPEPKNGTIKIYATNYESSINIHRLKIKIDKADIYVSLLYDSTAKAEFCLGGIISTQYLKEVYIYNTMDKKNFSDPIDLINIRNLGIFLNRNSWKNWIETDCIVIPQKMRTSAEEEIILNNSSNEIILKFSLINFERKIYLQTDIKNFNKEEFETIIQVGENYSVINTSLNPKSHTSDAFNFQVKELITTLEIIKVNCYDRFNLTLFATLSAIAFFTYSTYLSIVSGNEIKKSVEKDLKESSEKLDEKSNDLEKRIEELTKEQRRTIVKIDNLNRKLADLNKKQTRRK